jgi:hypothetical protein
VASVASAVVSYLDGIESDPAQLLDSGQTSEGSAGCYYADSSEGAGRWIGSGARFRGLAGVARLLGVIRSEVDELVIAAHKVALGTDRLVLRPRHYRLEDPMNLNDQPRCAESA